MLNEELLLECHKELDGRKAVGIDEMTKAEYSLYIPKANGKKRPLGIASYEDKIVQQGLKKILEGVY